MRFLISFVALVMGATVVWADDPLAEVNAKRATRGLKPFTADPGLTTAAQGAANFRAAHLMFGHTSNDFSFVPAGASAASAGCAAYPASYGWLSCCTYEGYTYAGAAYAVGADGKRYMHLFVSNTPSPLAIGAVDAPPTIVAPPQTAAPCATVAAPQYRVEQRGLFGRRSVVVPVGTTACATVQSITVTATTATATTGACTSGSCGIGTSTFRQRTTIRSR